MNTPLRDADLLYSVFKGLSDASRKEFLSMVVKAVPRDVWEALSSEGAIDFSILKFSERIPP